ncbi:pilus assembly protein [Hydrogenophaga sp.]|uniref:pilus assembly protein n=1 Tax=Hydrogenophaga sp. TaxID=1904254 RepID=UPI002725C458|nr:PilC/PilY family type IV pilus protein [Hydrogenophaga sp.]MDO9434345.1 PilC/PilY family type IV pilus protein [Hydrogenophaga sp.]
MKSLSHLNNVLKFAMASAVVLTALSVQALTWPTKPLGATISAKPLTMLVAGRDHKFFYEAYNDASDIDGDGTLDTRFKPSITYFGLYDSTLCYAYGGSGSSGLFSPGATADNLGRCSASTTHRWSGNWLNYVTTSRMDALRKVLYGGYREVDGNGTSGNTQTILRRAYIPQDAHSWAKEYHSLATDGYLISDYTPLAQPTLTTRRHFFGNLTANRDVNCSTLNNCSNMDPLLRLRTNVGDNRRVWEWASKERPVLHDTLSSGNFPSGTGAEVNYTVRVLVCTPTYNNDCKQYPNGQYKPTGLLHDYGENDAMLFGLLTGSYDNHMSGGRLRKVVASFSNEVVANTGVFQSTAQIVNTFNNIRIRGFNQSSSSGEYWKSDPYTDSAKAATEGQLVDWGNPIGEMLYEATRYFAGKKTATSTFNTSSTIDAQVGLSSVAWDDPYESTSAAKASYCARPNFLTISDINPSFDSNTMPGSHFASYTGDITGLNVKTLGDTITAVESNITGLRFIGQSGTGIGSYDAAPTPKTVSSLGTIRGLAPEEPTKEGSYYSASMAYYAKTTDLRPTLQGRQTVDNYVVALSSPLPRIEAKLPNGRVISLVPFSKSVGGSGISAIKGNYQPTNQIVDFYVEQIANSGTADADPSINGGRYYARFQINFEDVEQGGDHDMDAISEYTVEAKADNTLAVTVRPTYQAGGIYQNMGYVISGSTRDGVYLVARDETGSGSYFLNVPAGRTPGYCDVLLPPLDCATLPAVGAAGNTFVFSPNSGAGGATLLRDPLWYAAKWGGFVDRNNSNTPDLPLEWDANGDGVPDTYFLVQNPLKLREALKKAFDNIIEKSGSGGNIIANSTVLSTDSLVYQATFNSTRWSGDLSAYPVTDAGVGSVAAWKAADRIPDAASRTITYWSDSTGTDKGKLFIWSNLSTSERALLNNSQPLVNYLRGNRSREIQNGGTLRDRAPNTVLGDITHSSPAYVKDTNTVYVGANDGMLHAFDAKTGDEIFAHIPSSVLSRLKNLSNPTYNENHEYFVDGDIAVSTRTTLQSNNYLVATLGRGGKGLFGLDVSDPANFAASNVTWEYFSDAGETQKDLGFMLGRPVLATMNDGTRVVIVGNGYNSTSGRAVLYIFNMVTGALVKKIDTGVGGDNGLATPGLFDSNGDGQVDFIYAGDLKGNVWKFDVSGTTVSSWALSNGNAPLYQAKDANNKAQPITAPIRITRNDVNTDVNFGQRFIHFGTGRYITADDASNTDVQTLYGLVDRNATIPNRLELVPRAVLQTGTFGGQPVRTFAAATAGDMAGKQGFYLDFPAAGERIVTATNIFRLAEPTLVASTLIPVVDVCTPGGNGYLNAVNPYTGARLTKPFFDVNDNGQFTDDLLSGNYIGSIDLGVGMPGEAILVGRRLVVGGSKGTVDDVKVNTPTLPVKGRLTWREIVRD